MTQIAASGQAVEASGRGPALCEIHLVAAGDTALSGLQGLPPMVHELSRRRRHAPIDL